MVILYRFRVQLVQVIKLVFRPASKYEVGFAVAIHHLLF